MRGSVTKRGDRWVLRVSIGWGPERRDKDGQPILDAKGRPRRKRQQLWFSFASRREAYGRLGELLGAAQRGAVVKPSKITVGEFLTSWLAHAKMKVGPKTYETYTGTLESHIRPELGLVPLQSLSPVVIQAWVSRLLESGRKDGKPGGLSAKTVTNTVRVLHVALQHAVRLQAIYSNPADAVELPRVSRPKPTVLDEGQTAALLKAADGTPLYVPVMVAVQTGMRKGEILGLLWNHVDLKAGAITVHQSLTRLRGRSLVAKEPKTPGSIRRIALPPTAVKALKVWKLEQERHARMVAREAWEDRGFVCTTEVGRPLDPARLSRAFAALVARAGLPHVRFHDLRHGHATHLLRKHIPLKVVSARLGHAGISVTADRYSHVLDGMDQGAAAAIDEALLAASEKEGATEQI